MFYFVFCFLVLEETHFFDERPRRANNIQRVFCASHPAAKDPTEQLNWTDAQIVCWGECSDESHGKGPKNCI